MHGSNVERTRGTGLESGIALRCPQAGRYSKKYFMALHLFACQRVGGPVPMQKARTMPRVIRPTGMSPVTRANERSSGSVVA